MGDEMKCSRCNNTDSSFFYAGSRGWYCRKCIRFREVEEPENELKEVDPEYRLSFELTSRQADISRQLTEMVRNGDSVLLEAVCGAGKTEIIFEMIADCLRRGKKVGISIARRQVVLEIAERLAQAFQNLKVIPVCQGFTDNTMGDLIVCTTHQLYRYRNYFDVLILDEPDAFPFKGDEVLHGLARNSCHGCFVYLTATPDQSLKNDVTLKRLYLSKRPHGHDLCVPEKKTGPSWYLVICGLSWLIRELRLKHKILLFVPSRAAGRMINRVLGLFVSCSNISSDTSDKDQVIKDFRNGKYSVCVCTSVLERGITIADVQVLVWQADNGVFDEAALTQISGRVGRSKDYPEGRCLFLCSRARETVDHSIASVVRANND